MVSSTVTVAVQDPLLPALSVTVRVTVFDPVCEQPKLFGVTLIEAIPLLELDPLSTCDARTLAPPLESRYTAAFLHNTVKLGPEILNDDELVPVHVPFKTDRVPVVAPAGTVACSWVLLMKVTLPDDVPLNLTVLDAVNPVPLMVTKVPAAPLEGLNPLILGTANTVIFCLAVSLQPFAPVTT